MTASSNLLRHSQLPAADLQLLEPIGPVPTGFRHLAGLADIAELFGKLHLSNVRTNQFLFAWS